MPSARRGTIILLLLTAWLLPGCPPFWNSQPALKNLGQDELYREAEAQAQNKNYRQAVENYERLLSAYPDFPKAAEVHLKIGDALYQQKAYEKAIARYQQFIELYPSHKDIPRAKYFIALSYFDQIKKVDLDISIVQRAAEAFREISTNPDAGEWAKKAEEKYGECRKKMAEKELYKAKMYANDGNVQAARIAAQRILDTYPKLGYDKEAKEILDSLKKR